MCYSLPVYSKKLDPNDKNFRHGRKLEEVQPESRSLHIKPRKSIYVPNLFFHLKIWLCWKALSEELSVSLLTYLTKHILVYTINLKIDTSCWAPMNQQVIYKVFNTLSYGRLIDVSRCSLSFFSGNRFSDKHMVFHLGTVSQPTQQTGSHVTKFFSKECGQSDICNFCITWIKISYPRLPLSCPFSTGWNADVSIN